MDWAIEDLVSMRFHLIGQRQVLQKAHDDLKAQCSQSLGEEQIYPPDPGYFDPQVDIQQRYNMVVRERDELRDQISRQRNVVMELKRQRSRLLQHISDQGEFY